MSETRTVTGQIIEDLDEFKAQWEQNATDPAQSVLFLLMGSYIFAQGDTALGEAMVTVVLREQDLWKDPKSPTGFKMALSDRHYLDQIAEHPQVGNAYHCCTPDNGYQVDPQNLAMQVVGEFTSGNDGTISIQSAGKDFATPINVQLNDEGQWKLLNISSLATGVKPAN